MNKVSWSFLQIILCITGYLYASTKIAIAQVTPDNTSINTQVDQTGNVAEITGGQTRGSNLFHSFDDFSVGTGNEAFFNNASDTSNIFSRVTGGNISNIDGAIRANGNANLFLINPAGIIFGNNARLDIGGSFYGSSSSSILFEDGEFSAVDLENLPLLTVNAPIGLSFRDEPGNIINRSNFGTRTRILNGNFDDSFAEENFTAFNTVGLEVDSGETIALIGGDILLENQTGITAPGGIVELGGLAKAGTVTLNNDGSLTYPDNIAKSDVSLTEDSQVDVRGDNEGAVNINSANLQLSQRSKLFAGIAEGSGSSDSQAGDITINADDSVKILGTNPSPIGLGTEINNHVGTATNRRDSRDDTSNAVGNGGNIIINTSLLEISDQARITANSYDRGNSGNLIFNTDNITINGGAIASLLFEGVGDVGDVIINNTENIVLNEGSNIQSQVLRGGEGNVGDISINTGTFAINEKFSFILADNVSAGDAGNITINASDSVFINGGGSDLGQSLSAILSQVQNDVVGDAGDITITTPQLSLTNFGLISTNVKQGSVGSTGDIFLNVDTLNLDNGSVIDALTENNFDGGSINVNANQVNLSNGGKIVTSGDRDGNAGSIKINVADTLTIRNDNPPTTVPFFEDILIDTASESGLFSSTVAGTGNGGNIEVNTGSLELASNGSISATTATGTGGNVFLNVKETIFLRNNSLISAEAAGFGSGGNITIDTNFIVAFPNGNNDILANADQGQGGNITIDAQSVFGIVERPLDLQTNDINATSEVQGLDGNISITTPDINPVQDATKLPSKVVEPEAIAQQVCQNNRETAAKNGLSIQGKGGIQAEPGLPLNSLNISIDGQTNSTSVVPKPIETSQGKIQPARGVKLTKSGEIILTASNRYNDVIPQGSRNCGGV